jgi:PAS domain S-box-containing protein
MGIPSNNRSNTMRKNAPAPLPGISLVTGLISFWNRLTDPLFKTARIETRRKIQLIASLLLIFTSLAVLGLFISPPDKARYLAIFLLITLVLYLFSRTRVYKPVIFLSLLFLSASQYWIILTGDYQTAAETEAALLRLVAILLLGVSLLSLFGNIVFILLNLIPLLLLPLLLPSMDRTAHLSALGLFLICSLILITNIRYRDLSEQDRQSELLKVRKFSDDIIRGFPGIFFMYDANRRLIRWNDRLEEITGVAFEEMSNLDLADHAQSGYKETVEEMLERAHRTGRAEAEVRLLRSDGQRVSFFITVISDRLGEKTYLLGLGIDVTGLKRAEEAYRAIVVNSLQGLAIYQKGRIVFANPAYAGILGYAIDELSSMDPEQVANLFYFEDRQKSIARMNATFSGEEAGSRYEARVVCKDGSLRWIDFAMSVINYRDEVAIQAAAVDITDRKQMESEQARLVQELETKNAELERFSYTVSHDLKSPLITIRGFLGFLIRDSAANNVARVKADIQRITEATDQMHRLLDDLLTLSRVGRVTNPPERVPFDSIATAAAEQVGGQIRTRGVEVKIAHDLPTVFVDRERIVEVVQNLLDNAVKFMGDQPEPRIEIGSKESNQADQAILFVRDNGMGIDPQYHDRIFGLFNKLNPDTQGTGIGLALVKRILEYHNGYIWVESKPGEGATFYFTLPRPARSEVDNP